jgi:uncharacterized protein YndB with AHSA1/START domain
VTKPAKKPDYVHVIYIAATQERVWETMLRPDFAKRFFAVAPDGPWAAGAELRAVNADGTLESDGRVLAFDPPKSLTITWLRVRIGGELRVMPKAQATVTLEQIGDVVRVTMTETHEDPVDESYLQGGIQGWPISASRLKTLVETGQPLPPVRGTRY